MVTCVFEMPISLSCKLEFVVTILLVTVKSIASYKEEQQQGLTECIQIYNGKTLLGVEGESGSVVNAGYPGVYSAGSDVPAMCEVALRACNSCRFHIDFEKLQFPVCNISPTVEYTSQLRAENWCLPGCDHIHVSEGDRPYNLYFHKNYFSVNETTSYDSISSYVRIIHCMSNATLPEGKKFKIIYRVVAKKKEFTGSPNTEGSSSDFLVSPNFPHGYALNGEIFIYSIQNLDHKGFIQLVFDDWDVAQESEIQVFDGNLQPPIILKHFERPIIFSNTSSLLLLFHTGSKLASCCSNIGFKATFSFVSERSRENIRVDCGATLPTSIGGGISFHGMSSIYGFSYDCVWVIKKIPEEKYNYQIHLHLKELSMKDGWEFEKKNSLEIHNGISSVERLVAQYTCTQYSQTQTWNTPDQSQGFYVRLRGNFYRQDKIRFSYTAASTMTKDGCPEKFKYPCFNILCIALSLKCDGIDHCGDNSDEAPALECSSPDHDKVNKQNSCEGKFLCDDNVCLDMSHHCDNIQDCADGSDEKSCHELSPVTNGWRFSISSKLLHLSIIFHIVKVFL